MYSYWYRFGIPFFNLIVWFFFNKFKKKKLTSVARMYIANTVDLKYCVRLILALLLVKHFYFSKIIVMNIKEKNKTSWIFLWNIHFTFIVFKKSFDWHFFNSKISYFNIYKNYNTVISKYQYSITEGKETMQLNEVIFKHLILKQHFGLFI